MSIKLDLIDRRLLYELDLDSSIPITRLAKKLQISKDRANYRIENLKKKGIIKKFVTQVNASLLGYSVYKLFVKFQNLTSIKKQEILNWMIKNKYIYWISEFQGRWDLNIALFAKDVNQFDQVFLKFTGKFGKFISNQEVNITVRVGILNKSWINKGSKQGRKYSSFLGQHNLVKMDKKDLEILKVLTNNYRISYVKLAERLKTTPRVIIYRIKELEKKGIIMGYSISIDYEKMNKQFFKANIYFNFLNEELRKRIETYCKSRPNIIYFIFCIGGWPLEIEFNVAENKEFYDEMNLFGEAFPEMKNYDTLLFTKEHKFNWIPECYNP